MPKLQLLRQVVLSVLLVQLLSAFSIAKKETHPDFIPLKELVKAPLPEAIAISPNGRYLAGQRYEEFGETYRQTIFCYDLQEGKAWSLGNGKYDNWISSIYFLTDEHLLVRFRFSDSWVKIHISGSDTKTILPDPRNVKHPLFFLRNAWIISTYIPEAPGSIIVDLDDFSKYTGEKNNKFLKEANMPRGLYKVDTNSLEWELLVENKGQTLYYELDENDTPKLAYQLPGIEYDKFGDRDNIDWLNEFCVPKVQLLNEKSETRELDIPITYKERNGTESFASPEINTQNNTLRFLSDNYDTTIALKEMDLSTGEISTVTKREDIAIDSVVYDAWVNKIVGVNYHDGIFEQDYLDPQLQKIYKSLKKLLPGWSVQLFDWDLSRKRILVKIWKGDSHGVFFLYDKEKGTLEEIYTEAPWADKFSDKLSKVEPISYQSRDGLTIHGYLTKPSNPKLSAPYPTIFFIHGGPWARDYFVYDPFVQFFANRGYAVVQINFRGSSGYTKAFLEAGNGQWGKKMQDDITDGVHWAINQGIADKDRIGIAGASYGGYATLMGLCTTPDLYAVGIPMMSVSDISRQIDHYESYEWDEAAKFWKDYVVPENGTAENLKEVSPVYLAKNVQAPILLYHGRRDKRVDANHTSRFVKALKRHKIKFQSLYSKDEGHGFRDPENLEDLLKQIEKFLAKNMPSDLM
ncbi:alpha/beta hydrolase family protein [Pelagicoccus mobilis]|uniref:S9 family peptidase n=1 Tax=Pelagicoccus mobilis TaxID=415221 RepID=A0A934RTW8_9BACT|nr:S9 family peptidase [Pelagicoccus mobilis]MBK1876797.1 S9 family peptidase [Pelagicoccus mobilis]